MKRGLLLLIAAFMVVSSVSILRVRAVPAYPHPITITQSDGTQLTIRIIGDEFNHYTLTEEGYTVIGGPGGDYYYAQLNNKGMLVPTAIMARPTARLNTAERTQVMRMSKAIRQTAPTNIRRSQPVQAPGNSTLQLASVNGINPPGRISTAQTKGKVRSLVILIETSETRFTVSNPNSTFTNLLNQDGYSINSASGSAWNYYYTNSNGQFDPEFVVVGPYRASQSMEYYAKNDMRNMDELVNEACDLANAAGVDFSQFADNGTIRDIFIFYAGYNEAEGVPNTIWPHRGGCYKNLNGAVLRSYACTSEYRGDSGKTLAGIGTFCHEFGHVLGWPDLYDTDYGGSGGTASGLENYSLMCSGSYNNMGRTPPAVNILERWMVGWATPVELTKSGAYTLDPVTSDMGYLVRTGTNNDYFLLEYRGAKKTVWDNPADFASVQGLMAYHVDYTKTSPWISSNSVNVNPQHEYMRLVRSNPGFSNNPGKTFFPGSLNVKTLTPQNNPHYKAWSGGEPYIFLSNISVTANTAVTFNASTGLLPDWKFNATTYQNDAILTWQDAQSTSWNVSWKKQGSSENLGSETVNKSEIHIGNLIPNATYEITITPSPENKENPEQGFVISTSDLNSESVHISLNGYEYPTGKPLLLSANSTEEIKSIKWYIDGQATTSTYLTLPAGEHKITMVATDQDNSEEYIIKYILIK